MAINLEDQIVSDYEQRRSLYALFTEKLHEILKTLIEQGGIELAASECRAKDVESLREKTGRDSKGGKYKKLEDITDLSGIRLVMFVREDCENVERIVRENFKVDKRNSVNKMFAAEVDRFGYASNHIVISFDNDRAKLPDFAPFKGMKAEIQIRTLLQHTWAAIDWRMRYKSKAEVPTELRRTLFGLSALLEVADGQFSDLSLRASALKSSYIDKINKGNLDIEINADSVRTFIGNSKKWSDFEEKIRRVNMEVKDGDLPKEKVAEYVVDFLKYLNIDSIQQLEQRIAKLNQSMVENIANIQSDWTALVGSTPYWTPEGLLRTVLLLQLEREVMTQAVEMVFLNKDLKSVIAKRFIA